MNLPPTLRDIARQRTSEAHRGLEATPLMCAISAGSPTDSEYRDYLAGQLGLHAPLEAALQRWVPPDWSAVRLIKAQWLVGDLATMGGAGQPVQTSPVRIDSEAEALGTLYVLEGGTLGLQVVRKRMQAGSPGRGAASRFMQGYGDATGSNWREFVARLETLPEAVWPQALDAACATFAAFQRRFASLRSRVAP